MKPIDLGTGTLNWPSFERVCDRYGTVNLYGPPDSEGYVEFDDGPLGEEGDLIAVVLQTRQSSHVADAFRGIGANTPAVGDEITLGSGTLFVEDWPPYGSINVGLKPGDGRDHDWLDPNALYRCHDQIVRLEFWPKGSR